MQNGAQGLCNVALAATLAVGSQFVELAPAFGQSATPTPTSTPTVALPGATATAQFPTSVQSPTTAQSPSSSQATSDQIGAIANQVAQVVKDPLLSVDAKSQQITSLAAQFNQLVLVWQQQTSAASGIATQLPGGVGQLTPTPLSSGAALSPTPFASLTPTPVAGASTGGPMTADQLRAQIATVTQKMAQVSQDTSISADLKTAQLSSLADQFNQLMTQLKQLGG